MKLTRECLLAVVGMGLFLSCGYKIGYKHFAGPIIPIAEQKPEFEVGDDQSITFHQDRLEVKMRPLTDEMLNRQFANHSTTREGFYQNPSVSLTNPYTYGDWRPLGKERSPKRFLVLQLSVKNYAFPKVRVQPSRIHIVAPNGRSYGALSLAALLEYYWPHAVGYAGITHRYFQEREDILRQTLFPEKMIFSGQEIEGYVVFPTLEYDVEEFTVWIDEMALRFNYRDEPVETVDIPFSFRREVYLARHPRPEHQ